MLLVMKNEQIIPQQTLNADQIAICRTIAKHVPWPVDLEINQINVPQGQLEIAAKQINVRRLINTFKFSLQSTIV
jgi:hypothetical protein